MTLTKSHIINAIAERNRFTCKKSTEAVEIILKLIKSVLKSGENVLISSYGNFMSGENGSVEAEIQRLGRI